MTSLVLALALTQVQFPNESRASPGPAPAAQPTVVTRSLLAGGAGVLASGAALGISVLLLGQNPAFDPTFANAALGAMLVAGVTFSIHQALGGRGEVLLALLLSAVTMAGSAAIASAIDGSIPTTAILTTAIGAVPAAAAAVLGLEGTSPAPKPRVQLAFGPGVVSGRF